MKRLNEILDQWVAQVQWWGPPNIDRRNGSDLVCEGSEVFDVHLKAGDHLRAEDLKYEFFYHKGERVSPDGIIWYESARIHKFDV
jgi:hypothetical protein